MGERNFGEKFLGRGWLGFDSGNAHEREEHCDEGSRFKKRDEESENCRNETKTHVIKPIFFKIFQNFLRIETFRV